MIGSFRSAVEFVISQEGAGSDDPNDPGHLTRFGISQRAFPDVDIASLTRDGAVAIYLANYWTPIRGDELPQGVDLSVMDEAVNTGTLHAAKMLQRIVGVPADGKIGPHTIAAAKYADPFAVISAYAEARIDFYFEIGSESFLHGWCKRAIRCAAESVWQAAAREIGIHQRTVVA